MFTALVPAAHALREFAYVEPIKNGQNLRLARSEPNYTIARAQDVAIMASVRSGSGYQRSFSELLAAPSDRFLAATMTERFQSVGDDFVEQWTEVYSLRSGANLVRVNEHACDGLRQATLPLRELVDYALRNEYDLADIDYDLETEGPGILPPVLQFNRDGTFETQYLLYAWVVDRVSGFRFDTLGPVTVKLVYALADTSGVFLGFTTSSRLAALPPPVGTGIIGRAKRNGALVVGKNGTALPFGFTIPLQYRTAVDAAGYILN